MLGMRRQRGGVAFLVLSSVVAVGTLRSLAACGDPYDAKDGLPLADAEP